MSFLVDFTTQAREDLRRLYEHLLQRATTVEALVHAQTAIDEITSATASLKRSPFIYRKAAEDPFLRELLVPFGASGYVLLYKIVDEKNVAIVAVRHQLEDDYH